MAFIVLMYDGKYTYFTTVCCLFIINLLELFLHPQLVVLIIILLLLQLIIFNHSFFYF